MYLPSGSFLLDHLLGGGYPVGYLTELFGPANAGKTTLCAALAATHPRLLTVWFGVDELDTRYLLQCGVSAQNTIFVDSPYLEQIQEVIRALTVPCILVVDSLSMLVSEHQDDHITYNTSALVDTLQDFCAYTGSTAVVTSQVRAGRRRKRSTAQYTVQRQIKTRIELRMSEETYNVTATVARALKRKPGERSRIFVEPFGVNTTRELLEVALTLGVLQKNGSWYYLYEQPLGQGMDDACKSLDDGWYSVVLGMVLEMKNLRRGR